MSTYHTHHLPPYTLAAAFRQVKAQENICCDVDYVVLLFRVFFTVLSDLSTDFRMRFMLADQYRFSCRLESCN